MTPPAPVVAPFRRLQLGFGIASGGLGVAAAVVLVVAESLPSAPFDQVLLGLALAGLAAVAWLAAGTLAVVARRFPVALLAPPVLLVLLLVAAAADLPLRLRFAAARAAFENAVAARGEAGPGAPCPERIATYRIARCVTIGSITHFYTAGGFLDAVGFAYAPDGVPADSSAEGAVSYDLLRTSWYTFGQAF